LVNVLKKSEPPSTRGAQDP